MNKRVGFVGVGLMGHGMAKNLVEKGFPLTVLGHRNRQPVEDLVARGAKEAKDIAEVVSGSDIVFLCVTGSPQVEDLVYRKGGILDSCRRGQIVVDTSTSQPLSTLKIAADLEGKGVRFVDAPLTRTPVEAEQGRLNTMVGCDQATFKEIEPVLKAFCENIFRGGFHSDEVRTCQRCQGRALLHPACRGKRDLRAHERSDHADHAQCDESRLRRAAASGRVAGAGAGEAERRRVSTERQPLTTKTRRHEERKREEQRSPAWSASVS
jgi:hypothetical protein